MSRNKPHKVRELQMDLRSIKPGLPAADLFGRVHPRTGEPIVPLGHTKHGQPIWPVLGGDDDTDPNDPRFTGEGGGSEDDDDDDEDESEEDDDPKAKRGKGKSSDDDDDDDDETYTREEYDALRTRMRNADRNANKYKAENDRLRAQLAKAKRTNKSDDDDTDDEPRVDNKAKEREDRRERELRQTRLENGFLRASRSVTDRKTGDPIEFHDAEDALAVADRLGLLDDVLDDDGTVDRREMVRALRELARRKPHLVVKKASGRSDDSDSDDDNDDQRSSAPSMNGKRKGSRGVPDRGALAKRFPVLNRGS